MTITCSRPTFEGESCLLAHTRAGFPFQVRPDQSPVRPISGILLASRSATFRPDAFPLRPHRPPFRLDRIPPQGGGSNFTPYLSPTHPFFVLLFSPLHANSRHLFFLQLRRMMNSTRGDPTLACASDYPRRAGIKTSSSGVRWPGWTQAPPWGWLYWAGYAPRHLLGRTGGTPHQVHHRLNQKQTWILSSLLRRLSPTAARQGSDHVEHGNHIWLGGQLLLSHWTSLLHGSQGDGLHVPAWR